jgi:hypothetical protein
VSATEAVAQSHLHLANRIEADVERPLREFATSNREVQAMGNISGNLSTLARDIDTAQKKVTKLRDKGSKAKASSVADAAQDVEKAEVQWDSQAPFVFEQLQAVDETRLNHLRDVLTQFQTHEVDQVERSRITAEDTLNTLLTIETADEIQTWALRMRSGDLPHPSRKLSSAGTPTRNLAPPPGPTSPSIADDNRSQKSGSGMYLLLCPGPSLMRGSTRKAQFKSSQALRDGPRTTKTKCSSIWACIVTRTKVIIESRISVQRIW